MNLLHWVRHSQRAFRGSHGLFTIQEVPVFDVGGTLCLICYTCLVLSWNPLVQNCGPLYSADSALGRFIMRNDTYPCGWARPWWTCIKGLCELVLRAWCELYGAGVSARGRRRLVSHFTAESHPPSRPLFMCLAGESSAVNRKLSEAMVSLKGQSRLLREEIKKHWKNFCFESR